LSALLDFCAVMASWEAEQRGSKWSPPVDTSRGNGGGHGPPTRPRGFEAISSELERYIISSLQQHSHIPQNFILLHREGCTVQLMRQNKKAVVIHRSAVSRTRGSKFKKYCEWRPMMIFRWKDPCEDKQCRRQRTATLQILASMVPPA
jgi:hypothetical protein